MEEKISKRKTLIVFIGAGGATETQYAPFEAQTNGVGYVLKKKAQKEPILKQYNYPFLAKLTEEVFDQIVFIGTSGSKWGLLKNNILSLIDKDTISNQLVSKEDNEKFFIEYLNKNEIDNFKNELSNYLYEYILKTNSIKCDIRVEIILIKEGRTEVENKENIKKIQDVLSKLNISEITLDVTNGLRSHPMYVLPIISNLAAIYNKNIPINIYYGMYDAKLKETDNNSGIYEPDKNGIAPMVDLKEIQIMDKWTTAVKEFFSNGSVLQILELLEEKEIYFLENADNKKYNALYIEAFNTFSFAVNSNNLDMFQDAITKIHQLVNKQNMLVGISDEMPIYVQNSLKQVVSYIKQQFDWKNGDETTKYSSYMFSLANWYLKQNRLGDSVRTFQEASITYVMEAYPNKIFDLLEKRIIKWQKEEEKTKEECVEDKLFDAHIRKVLREAIYEDKTIIEGKEEEWSEWKEWKKEYDYMRDYVHNPDALLYNGSSSEKEKMTDIKEAKDNIIKFAKKMEKEREHIEDKDLNDTIKHMLECRIDYLLAIKRYDVFISYRRSYHNDKRKKLNDGVLLATAIFDYLEKKGLNVFIDKIEMIGKEGKFAQHLHNSLINSKICLIILGKNAYNKDYNDKDQYYKEIITAVQKGIKIAVVCMKGFYLSDNSVAYGKDVEKQKELMTVVNECQKIGSEFSDVWEYDNIWLLRECIYKEIEKMLNE